MIIEEFTKVQGHITSIYEFMLGGANDQGQSGVQVPQRLTMKNRNSLKLKGLSQMASVIGAVPYLLGDDDEVANQRSSWVQNQFIKNTSMLSAF